MSSLEERVYADITRLLHKGYGPGHRLPTERALAELCGVSQTIVRSALRRLKKEGFLRTVPRRGTFVVHGGRLTGRLRQYGIYLSANIVDLIGENGFEVRVVSALRRRLQAEHCALLGIGRERVVSRLTPKGFKSHPEEIPWNRIDGLFALGFEDLETLSHARLRAGPVLVLDQEVTEFGLDSVAFDDDLCGELAARHFLGLGHRRLGLVEQVSKAGFPNDPAWIRRRMGFERTILAGGGTIHPDWRLPWQRFTHAPAGGPEWAERLCGLLKQDPTRRPTAFFVPDLQVMESVEELLRTAGQPAPKAFSLAGVGHVPEESARRAPEARSTGLLLDPDELGRRAVDAMLEVLRLGPPGPARAPRVWRVPPRLEVGRTSAQCMEKG